MIRLLGFGDTSTEFEKSAKKLFDPSLACTSDSPWFREFWACSVSTEEVWRIFTLKKVRALRNHHCERLSILVHKLVDELAKRKEVGQCKTQGDRLKVLNCIRLLTRLIPILSETPIVKPASTKSSGDGANISTATGSANTAAHSSGRELMNRLFWKERPITLYRKSHVAVDTANTKGTSTDDLDVQFALDVDNQNIGADVSEQMSNAQLGDNETPTRASAGDVHGMDLQRLPSVSSITSENALHTPRPSSTDSLAARVRAETSSSSNAHDGPMFCQRMLGQRLLDAILCLAFVPGFCVTDLNLACDDQEYPIPMLWTPGVSVHTSGNTPVQADTPIDSQSHDVNANRAELLGLLLVCLSGTLYEEPRDYVNCTDEKFVVNFCTVEHRLKTAFLVSVLNTFCHYDPIGYGIPFNYLVAGDYYEELASPCVHVLIVLFSYQTRGLHASQGLAQKQEGEQRSAHPTTPQPNGAVVINLFDHFNKGLSLADRTVVYRALRRMLLIPSTPGYINTQQSFNLRREALLLLWRYLGEHPSFLEQVASSPDVTELVEPILIIALNNRSELRSLGIVHIAVFVLLILSSDRNFGVALNKPFHSVYGIDVASFTGHHGDVLLLGIHKLMTHGHTKLVVIHDHLLRIFSNVAPFLKSISKVTATKYIALFEILSSPRYVCSSPHHPNFLYYLLEGLNSLIHYHFDGNVTVAYAILRRRELFEKLDKLQELPQGLTKPKSSNDAPAKGVNSEQANSSDGGTANGQVVSKNDWKPTTKWIQLWKSSLPLATILALIGNLGPKVDDFCIKNEPSEEEIVEYLRAGTIVGLLPPAREIRLHKYQPQRYDGPWLAAYIWGVIYLSCRTPEFWIGTNVQFFEVKFVGKDEKNI